MMRVVVVLLCIPFVFVAVYYYFEGAGVRVTAEVNGSKIYENDFQDAYTRQRQALRNAERPVDDEAALRRQVLDGLIDGEVVLQFSNDAGVRISDQGLVAAIRDASPFQQAGFFNQEIYENLLRAAGGLSAADYEASLRSQMAAQQMQDAIAESSFLLDDEVRRIARLQAQQRDIAFVRLPVADVEGGIELDEEAIERFYREHGDDYLQTEQLSIAYLELSAASLEERVEVAEEDVEAFYQGRSDTYDIEEERKVTQLVVDKYADASAEEMELARGMAEDFSRQAREQGKTLEEIVEEADAKAGKGEAAAADAEEPEATDAEPAEADRQPELAEATDAGGEEAAAAGAEELEAADAEPAEADRQPELAEAADAEQEQPQATEQPEVAEAGQEQAEAGDDAPQTGADGDTEEAAAPPREINFELVSRDFVPRRDMEEALAGPAFEAEPGSVGELVETDTGFYLLRVDEIKEGRDSTFENSREDAEADYRKQEAERLSLERADELARLAFETPHTLAPAADALELELLESELFPRTGGEGITAEEAIREAAFATEVLQEGNNSELIELAEDRVVVLRVLEHRPAVSKPLEEVRAEVERALRLERATKELRSRGDALVERLRAGEDMERLAEAEGLQWDRHEKASRDATELPRAVTRTAFRLGQVEQGPAFAGESLGNGDYMLTALLAVHEIEADSDIGDEKLDQLWQQLGLVVVQADWREFLDILKSEADIDVLLDRDDEVEDEPEPVTPAT